MKVGSIIPAYVHKFSGHMSGVNLQKPQVRQVEDGVGNYLSSDPDEETWHVPNTWLTRVSSSLDGQAASPNATSHITGLAPERLKPQRVLEAACATCAHAVTPSDNPFGSERRMAVTV